MAGKKITKAPSGTSFMYEPREPVSEIHCTQDGCNGIIVHTEGGFPTCNEGSVFICTECDWISPDGYEHEPTERTVLEWGGSILRSQPSKRQTEDFISAFRAEKAKQMKRLIKERAKFPPSLLKKGKRWVFNPKFTSEMREHMHTFAINEDEIAAQIVASGIRRFAAPQKKVRS